jgi:predicted transcriptional regulator
MATVTPPPVSFRLSRDQQLALDSAAARMGQSRSDLIRSAIFAYIGKQKINQGVSSALVSEPDLNYRQAV